MHALVTLNVFQNCFISEDPCWRYFANLLRILASKSVYLYITEPDCEFARHYFVQYKYQLDEVCQKVYLSLLEHIRVCVVDAAIWEETTRYPLVLPDRIRLACALDHHLDAIVTYEPQQFALTAEDLYKLQINGYFSIGISSECAETGSVIEKTVNVFSVSSFLIYLDQGKEPIPLESQYHESFRLHDFHLTCERDESHATISLHTSIGTRLEASASGRTPVEVIQKAIDRMVDQIVQMPSRRIIRYAIPLASLCSAESPVDVVICVECEGSYFEHSACSSNSIRAVADAYIKAINTICRWLDLPVFQPDDES